MATNLLSTIMQSFTPDVVGKLASTLGLEQQAAQKGISAGVPGILSGLANMAQGSDGPKRIGYALSQSENIVGRDAISSGDIIGSLLGSNRDILQTGWSLISSLIGGGTLDTLSSRLAQYAGLGQGSAKKLIGFLAPVVLAYLKRHQTTAGLDNQGVASMLVSQKGEFERAIPSASAGRPVQDTPHEARSSSPAHHQRTAAAGGTNWAYWLLPALIIAGAALYFWPNENKVQEAQQINRNTRMVTPAPESATGSAPSATPFPSRTDTQQSATNNSAAPMPPQQSVVAGTSAVALQNDILDNITRLQAALNRIKDTGSAQAAIGEIRDISDRFASLKSKAQELTPEARQALAQAVQQSVPNLNSTLDRIGNEINLGGEAKPVMDTLKNQIANLSKA
ncbi:hypothetical protein Rvan_0961 [Rhodomicrobium vannielii ATCC 17100]|uniref:DUF937 domain-containing protein n=1 Tax=Rhodomicrobium vannielii (strain ATCC 17100 / DSM 162 / LMG 4299 / NCIMB 10020 / ATH 3.1.1) TaxID=648757 RepID=E3I2F3_RHOVT|nr:DUF937 domain-containing protein [Rhodomicrobium vannielii]ADP70237.1 hypothetical protein Rvan_0961 [Rhodomicrobium vannielii ATCC 17100]